VWKGEDEQLPFFSETELSKSLILPCKNQKDRETKDDLDKQIRVLKIEQNVVA
jgi:hypothetical protein